MGDITAQMAASMGSIDAQNHLSTTQATANTNTTESTTSTSTGAGTTYTFSSISGNSLTIDLPQKGAPGAGITFGGSGIGPDGIGGPGGIGGIGDGHGGAGQPGGLGGVGGFLGVGDNNPVAKMAGYSMKQLAQEYPDIANKIVSLAKEGNLQSAAAKYAPAATDVKDAFKSEMKDTAKDIADHPFVVDEVRTPGGVGGPGQVGGLGGLQHPLGDLAAKSVEQLSNQYPNVANYLKSIAGDGNILNLAQEDSNTAVRNQMKADTPTNIAA